jgi:Major intrinsic protein
LTGAVFNPARAIGPMIVMGNFEHAWLYVLAPLVGALVAALVHVALARLAGEPTRLASTPDECLRIVLEPVSRQP